MRVEKKIKVAISLFSVFSSAVAYRIFTVEIFIIPHKVLPDIVGEWCTPEHANHLPSTMLLATHRPVRLTLL